MPILSASADSCLIASIATYVKNNVGTFHNKRLEKIQDAELKTILSRKNPYLFKAKNTETAGEIVKAIMDAYLSSQEETMFGDFLEGVAIFVCEQVYGGYKPDLNELTGIDLVFEKDDTIYIVEVKSGPNWGNSSQITKMIINFKDAISRLQLTYPNKIIVPINGCMYGKQKASNKPGKIKEGGVTIDKIPYWKLCGQDFWYFISDIENLYVDIIEPLGYDAKQQNETFQDEYTKLINRFTREFLNTYCDENGAIQWGMLAELISKSKSPVNHLG